MLARRTSESSPEVLEVRARGSEAATPDVPDRRAGLDRRYPDPMA
jgi:hypothetical protein